MIKRNFLVLLLLSQSCLLVCAQNNNTGKDTADVIRLLAQAERLMMQAQLPAAEDMLKESIRLSKELGIDRIQWHYGLLGAVQIQRRETVEALKNELLAIKIGEQYGERQDDAGLAGCLLLLISRAGPFEAIARG